MRANGDPSSPLHPKGFSHFLGPTALALVFLLVVQSLPFSAARALSYRRFSLHREGGVEVLCDTYTVAPGDFVLEIMRLKGQIAYREFREFMAIFRRLNPHVTDLSRIYPGQTIVIPLKKAPPGTFSADAKGFVTLPFASVTGAGEPNQPPPREAASAVRVSRGDSVSSIVSRRFGPVGSEGYRQGMARFRDLNPSVTDVNFIYAGEVVFVPGGEQEPDALEPPAGAAGQPPTAPDEGDAPRRRVRPGDTVAGLVSPVYGKPGSAGYRKGLAEFRRANPHISDVNRIYPGDVVRIPQSKPERPEPEKPVFSAPSTPLDSKSAPSAESPGNLAAKAAPAEATATRAKAEASPLTAPVAAKEAEPPPASGPAPQPLTPLSPALGDAEPAPPVLGKLAPALGSADPAPPGLARLAPAIGAAEPAPPSLPRLSGLPEKAETPAPVKDAAEAPRPEPTVSAPLPAEKPEAPPKAGQKAPVEPVQPSSPAPPPVSSVAPALGDAEPAPPVLGKLAPALGSADPAPPSLSRLAPAIGAAEPAPPSLPRLSGLPEKAEKPAPARIEAPAPRPASVVSAPAPAAKPEAPPTPTPLPPSRRAPPSVQPLTPALGFTDPAPPSLSRLSPALGAADPAPPSLPGLSGLPEEVERPSPAPTAAKPAPVVSGQAPAVKPAEPPKAASMAPAARAVMPPQMPRETAAPPARPTPPPVRAAIQPAVKAEPAAAKGKAPEEAKKPAVPPPAGKPPEPPRPAPAPPAPPKKPELVAGQGKARHPELTGLLKPFGVAFLDSGEYRFPGPGDAEFRLDLVKNPVAELPGGQRLVLCRGEALSASERAAVLSHWRNAKIVTLSGNATAKSIFGAVLEGAGIDSLKETVFSDGGATVTVKGDFVVPMGRGAGFEVVTWLTPPSARTHPSFVKYLESRKYRVRETGVPAVRSGGASGGGRAASPQIFSEGSRRELVSSLLGAAGVRYAKDVPVSFSYAGFDVTINADMVKCADGKEYLLDYGSIYGDTEKELARMGLSVISLGKQGSLDSMMEALWKNLALEYRRNPVFSAADRSREPVSSLAVPGHFAVLPGGASLLVTRFDPSKALDEFLRDKGVTVFVVASPGFSD